MGCAVNEMSCPHASMGFHFEGGTGFFGSINNSECMRHDDALILQFATREK
jgi:hypothetical protein